MKSDIPQTFQITVKGSIRFPQAVFRFLKEKSQADDLLAGRVWISTLNACRAHEEGGRGDAGEASIEYNSGFANGDSGDAKLETIARRVGINLGPNCSNITINDCTSRNSIKDAFVLCTTLVYSPDKLSPVFGNHCVEIFDSEEFFRRVSSRLHAQHPIKEFARGPVIYRPRQFHGLESEPGPLGFVKPPDQYQDQKEFRMLWVPHDFSKLVPFLLNVPEVIPLCRVKA